MKTRVMNNAEAYVIRKHKDKIGLPLLNRRGNPIWSNSQIDKAFHIEDSLRREKKETERDRISQIVKEEGEYYRSPEFRLEVMEALRAEGLTEIQAENRTRDQFHLFSEARRLHMM
jgi:hypothetical protein